MQNANAFGAPDCIQKPPRPEMSRSIKQFSKTTMQHYPYHGGTDEAQTGAVGNLSAFLVGAGAACLTPVPLRVLPAKVSNGPRIPKSGGGCPRKRTKKRPTAASKQGASNDPSATMRGNDQPKPKHASGAGINSKRKIRAACHYTYRSARFERWIETRLYTNQPVRDSLGDNNQRGPMVRAQDRQQS